MSACDILARLSPREVGEALSDENRWYAGAKDGIPISDEVALIYYWNATRVPKTLHIFFVHREEEILEGSAA